jgi:sodium/bile acid cotransporter 7
MNPKVYELLKRQWFLGALLITVLIGSAIPEAVMSLTGRVSVRVLVVPLMALMSLTLDTSEITEAIRQPIGTVIGVLLGYTVVPIFAWLVSHLFWHHAPGLAIGLLIVSAMPCTLASATLWTRMARGNDALALLITVGSNALNFLAAPLILSLGLGRMVAIPPWTMMRDLLIIILLPVAGGQLLRRLHPVSRIADRHQTAISLLGKWMILVLVLSGIARAVTQLQSQQQTFLSIELLSLLGAVAVVHMAALLCCELAGRLTGLPRQDRLALLFAGSQKTLPAGLYVAQSFFPAYALAGVPSLLYHAGQLVIDSFVAERLRIQSMALEQVTPGRP